MMWKNIIKTLLFICYLPFVYFPCKAQTPSHKLSFTTASGEKINVQTGIISVNGKNLYKLGDNDVIYSSKRSRIVENGGSVFLFLEINGSPNLDRFYVFKVFPAKVDSVAEAISSEIKDWDNDGFLEFGGSDLTEMHPSRDSMYYIPSEYYEIRNGNPPGKN